ncbi:MAG: (2Fe-2S) ferredoxin domain-containing protein [Sandaracinaceae bacterium]
MRELPTHFPTRAHLLVCTGPRCRERGAGPLFERLWQDLEQRRIAYYRSGGNVRLTSSGCQGGCSFGPNALAYARGEDGRLREAWYARQDLASLTRLAEALQDGAPLPAHGRYDDPER